MNNLRNTKIVCTVGPASNDYEVLKELVKSGMNVMRLNFSHGDFNQHLENIKKIRRINEELGTSVATMLDTRGPEIRTHSFAYGGTTLVKNSNVKIYMKEIVGDETKFSVTHENLINDCEIGGKILVDDGNVTLEVVEKNYSEGYILCNVKNDAYIKDRRGINVPDVRLSLDFISKKDHDDLVFGCQNKVDFVAASFVRNEADCLEMRQLLNDFGGEKIKIIAKIENKEGINNIDRIIANVDGIMVARGDLGVEIPVYEVPIIQRMIIKKCHLANIPVIVATQMLESMQKNPRPTRAEANDVATAVLDGVDAIMLSGETAAGKYPVESVKMMSDIAVRMQQDINYESLLAEAKLARTTDIPSIIALSIAEGSSMLPVTAIIAPTSTGFTARQISHFRPKVPIIAITPNYQVARSLSLAFGVHPLVAPLLEGTDEVINQSVNIAKDRFNLLKDEMVFVTCSMPFNVIKYTNMMKIEVIK